MRKGSLRYRASSIVSAAFGLALVQTGGAAAQPPAAQPPDEPVEVAPEEAPPAEEAEAEPAPPVVAPEAVVAAAPPPEPPVVEPPPPPAPGTWVAGGIPIKLTGSFFTRNEYRQHYDTLGVSAGRFQEGDFFVYRTRIGLGIGPIDIGRSHTVSMQFTPQATGTLGVLPSTLAVPAIGVYEGYLRIANPFLKLDAGRFMMNYGDSLVIGSLDWNEAGRSFDGFRARITPGGGTAWVDLFYTLTGEGWPLRNDPYGAGDQMFMGVYTDIGSLIRPSMNLDLYALGLSNPRSHNIQIGTDMMGAPILGTREGAFEVTVGARIKDRIGLLDYRVEGGAQFGDRLAAAVTASAVDVRAFQIDGEVGLNFADDTFRVGLEGLYATGNDITTPEAEGWDQLFPTAHKFLGLSDAFGARTNATSGVLHLSYKPISDLQLLADLHVFARPRSTTSGGPNGYAATELDVAANYALGNGLRLWGLYGLFAPNDDFYPSDDLLHYVEVELRYDLR